MYDVSAVPNRCLHLCMINVHVCMFKHSVLAILCMHMFMGLLAHVIEVWVASSTPVGGMGM